MLSEPNKRRLLSSFTTEKLVYAVVEPILIELGYKLVDNLTIFPAQLYVKYNEFGQEELLAVCTSALPISNSTGMQESTSAFIEQLTTAQNTKYRTSIGDSISPLRLISVSSQSISQSIQEQLRTQFGSRLLVWSQDELVTLIDKHLPLFGTKSMRTHTPI